jgi:hypothetical protein
MRNMLAHPLTHDLRSQRAASDPVAPSHALETVANVLVEMQRPLDARPRVNEAQHTEARRILRTPT